MTKRRFLSLWFPNAATPPDEGLAAWCQQYTPLVALQPPDGVLLDITGCAHLFGGEAALAAQIGRRLAAVRLGFARTAAAAWALARYGEGADEDIFPLPLAALDLVPRTITRLRRVGIRRVGELARLPRAELTAGFGREPVEKLARALGTAPEVLKFFTPPPAWRETAHFAEPIFAPAQLQAACTGLAADLCRHLAAAQRGATAIAVRFYRVDRKMPEFALKFASPCRDEVQIAKLAREKLTGIDPGFGVEAVAMAAESTEALAPAQTGIESGAKDFSKPINTLLNRLGETKIWQVAPHETHIPEYAARRLPVVAAAADAWRKPPHRRPVKLLAWPDAITAIAPVPDDPPVFFTWRGDGHRVARATGPERIARDWWCHAHDNTRPEAEHIRDYYEVEDASGARFWVFRAGTHGGAKPVRWFLHGLF